MITMWTQPTWGMSGPEFLWLYGTVCVVSAGILWWWRSAAGGPLPDGANPGPDLGIHELAMLGDGPQRAITSAATQLMRDGVLKRGTSDGTLDVAGELAEDADPLERAVYEAVARRPAMSVDAMRAEVLASDALTTMQTELVEGGLLLTDHEARPLRWRWLIGAALAALGIARLLATADTAEPVGVLIVMLTGVGYATQDLFRSRPVATRHGEAVVARWRDSRGDLARHAVSGESALTAALFGGAGLWLAEPEIASALGLPYESPGKSGDGGGGGGGGGCGGCGGCG